MNEPPKLGEIISGDAKRDAVHVAVAPVVAGEDLTPGAHVLLYEGKAFDGFDDSIGIVDPFLTELVKKGERFWLFLYPNTVTNIRHMWTHPAFAVKPTKGDANA